MLKPSSRTAWSWWKETMFEEDNLIFTISRTSKIFTIFTVRKYLQYLKYLLYLQYLQYLQYFQFILILEGDNLIFAM